MAGLGPFTSYTEPGVYPETVVEQDAVNNARGLRIPLILGTGSEFIRISDFELWRGSSSQADNPIFKDDISDQIDGVLQQFQLSNYPVVAGGGTGQITNDPRKVQIELNGESVPVLQLNGATGVVSLGVLPLPGDTLTASYYVRRRDTLVTEENLSIQATGSNTVFKTKYKPIVLGNDGGIATTDVTKVQVKVNGVPVIVSSLDGANGLITLQSAPLAGALVQVTYYTNLWQNTFDLLPYPANKTIRVGLNPGRTDFVDGVDYIIRDDKIFWGTTGFVYSNDELTQPATAPFDEDFIALTQYDNRIYNELAGIGDGSNRVFTVSQTPTDGSGLDKPIDSYELPNEMLFDLVEVRTGSTIQNAIVSAPVDVRTVNSTNNEIELDVAPPLGHIVLVTYYANLTGDSVNTLEVTALGGAGAGAYSVENANFGQLTDSNPNEGASSVTDVDFGTEGITFPSSNILSSNIDLQTAPGFSPIEDIQLEFQTIADPEEVGPSTEYYLVSSSRTVSDVLADGKQRSGNATTGVPTDIVAAETTFEFDLTPGDARMLVEAQRPGTDGNLISVRLVDPGAPSQPLTVTRTGFIITVELATDVGGAITSTATTIALAINADANSNALVKATASGTNAATTVASVSSRTLSGGNPQNGHIGQTYVDILTGVRFTVLSAAINPQVSSYGLASPLTVNYAPADFLEFNSVGTFMASSIPRLSVPGFKFTVPTTTGNKEGNKGIIETFDKAGNEPGIGDYYYVTFEFEKTNFEPRFHAEFSKVQAEFGSYSIQNPVVIAWDLANRNGSPIVGIKQVRKQPNSSQAAPSAYIDAIKELEKPVRGNLDIKTITPLTGNSTVLADLKAHCEKMSSIRYRKNRRAIVGLEVGSEPFQVKQAAEGLQTERITMIYPDGVIIGIVDEFGNEIESLLGGYYLAAAYAGLDVAPRFDVAESMIRKQVVGIKRLYRRLDNVEQNEIAVSGVTLVEHLDPVFRVRHDLTTDNRTVLSSQPNVAKIKDYMEEEAQRALDPFVGRKGTITDPDILQEIEDSYATVFQSARRSAIIKSFRNIKARYNEVDPRIVEVEAEYSPILPIVWIVVTNRVRLS